MQNGWILLHRKLLESLAFKNEKCLKVWVWCLLKANHQEKEFLLGRKKMKLKKGQFVTGGIKAEEFLDIARTTIYYWLDFLVSEEMIDIKKTNKYTIITIKNWDKYQAIDNKKTSNVTTNGQQKDTNNKDNNDNKNISKDIDAKAPAIRRNDIDILLNGIKQIVSVLDGTKLEQRRFAKNFLDSKIVEILLQAGVQNPTSQQKINSILRIFQLAKQDDFHSKNVNSIAYVYRKAAAIVLNSKKKGGVVAI